MIRLYHSLAIWSCTSLLFSCNLEYKLVVFDSFEYKYNYVLKFIRLSSWLLTSEYRKWKFILVSNLLILPNIALLFFCPHAATHLLIHVLEIRWKKRDIIKDMITRWSVFHSIKLNTLSAMTHLCTCFINIYWTPSKNMLTFIYMYLYVCVCY